MLCNLVMKNLKVVDVLNDLDITKIFVSRPKYCLVTWNLPTYDGLSDPTIPMNEDTLRRNKTYAGPRRVSRVPVMMKV